MAYSGPTSSVCGKRASVLPFPLQYSSQNQRRSRACSDSNQAGRVNRVVLNNFQRQKLDKRDDRQFYDFPRFVKHVDDDFLDKVTELYRQYIPDGGEILDLMSSWVSHLPPEVVYTRVIGHGMNAMEMMKNPRLDSFFIRNLNKEPDGWSVEDQTFDAVLCCVSVQYLQEPERVFAEIYRVLKPGGICIVTFSNRMFYSKVEENHGINRRQTIFTSGVRQMSGFFSCLVGLPGVTVMWPTKSRQNIFDLSTDIQPLPTVAHPCTNVHHCITQGCLVNNLTPQHLPLLQHLCGRLVTQH